MDFTYMTKANKYWRRRKYQRLKSNIQSRRKLPVIKLGGQDSDHQRQWKLKSAHRIKLKKFISPVKLLAKFQDGYINMMLSWANKIGKGRVSFNLNKRKHPQATIAVGGQQVDARLVMAIYNKMVSDRDHQNSASEPFLYYVSQDLFP